MTAPDPETATDPLFDESLDWVSRMASGTFGAEDRGAFARWRATSPDHEAAFRRAATLGHMARLAARELAEEDRAAKVVPFRRRTLDRRAILTGAVAASAAGVLAVAGMPRLLSRPGRKPDFATGIGERRVLALAPGLRVELDTESSIAVDRSGGRHQIQLIAGRAAVTAQLEPAGRVEVLAGKGRAEAVQARFDVEADQDRSCVTCVSGVVTLAYVGARVPLGARQQIVYTDAAVGRPTLVDAALATAWTRGQLVFHHTPLEEVVRQVNRYRPGRIVIVGTSLRGRSVSGVFHTEQIEDAVGQIEQITGAHTARLPGGVVIFS